MIDIKDQEKRPVTVFGDLFEIFAERDGHYYGRIRAMDGKWKSVQVPVGYFALKQAPAVVEFAEWVCVSRHYGITGRFSLKDDARHECGLRAVKLTTRIEGDKGVIHGEWG